MTSVSSYALTAAPRLTVTQAQAALSKAQVELSSGKLADIGLGLGSSTGTYLALGAQASRLQAIKDSNGATATTLTAATAGLDALRASATSFLASLTAASSTGATPGALVASAGADLDALTSTLNTAVNGNAIFAGIDTANPPMTAYTTGSAPQKAVSGAFAAAFNGQDPSTITQAQMQSYLGGSYADLFSQASFTDPAKTGFSTASDTPTTAQISTTETVNTSVSANADPFRQLAQAYAMVKEYGGSDFSAGAGQAVMAAASQLVSSALSGLTDAEAGLGMSQAALSSANTRMSTQIDYLTTQSGDLVGVDPTTLATQISGLQTQIQASYEVTSQLQQLSLVNFLK